VIRQGEVFWLDLETPRGSEPGYRRPCVVVQNNLLNRSRLNTVVVCALTSNLSRGAVPGNVALEEGEAGLAKRSVVNVSQIFSVDREYFDGPAGTLSRRRLEEVLAGIRFVIEPRDVEATWA
jgi:mRNA interferase MazF